MGSPSPTVALVPLAWDNGNHTRKMPGWLGVLLGCNPCDVLDCLDPWIVPLKPYVWLGGWLKIGCMMLYAMTNPTNQPHWSLLSGLVITIDLGKIHWNLKPRSFGSEISVWPRHESLWIPSQLRKGLMAFQLLYYLGILMAPKTKNPRGLP